MILPRTTGVPFSSEAHASDLFVDFPFAAERISEAKRILTVSSLLYIRDSFTGCFAHPGTQCRFAVSKRAQSDGKRPVVSALGRCLKKPQRGCLPVEGLVTAFMIVEIEVRGKTRSCLVHRVVGPEEHLLVLDAAPAALAVLAYADLVLFEHGEERFARELGALISVEDLGSAEPLDRLVERIHTEVRHQGVGQAPGKHRPARPVNDRHEVEKTPPGVSGCR